MEDFPGAGAILADADTVTEADLRVGPAPGCGPAGVPAIRVLDGASDPMTSLDAALAEGAHLVVFEPAPPAGQLEALVARQRARTCETGELAHVGVAGDLTARADVVIFAPRSEADEEALLAAGRTLRGRGARAVWRQGELPPRRAVLQSHLVLGGALWLAEPIRDPAVQALRDHRDLVGLPTARVALLSSPGNAEQLRARIAELEAMHVQFEVLDHDSVRASRGREGFDRVFGAGELDRPLRQRLERLSASDDPLVLPAVVETTLPGSVLIERQKLPARNALVHHLIRRAPAAPGERRTLSVTPWALGAAETCRATWVSAEAPDGQPLPCSVGPEGQMTFTLPSFGSWAALVTEPELPAEREGGPVRAIRLRPEDPMPGSMSLQMDVQGWDRVVSEVTLFVPERLEAEEGTLPLLEGARPVFEVSDDERRLTGVSEGRLATLKVDAEATSDAVAVTMQVTNSGRRPLADVRAMICLESKPAGVFPREGHDRTWVAGPGGPIPLASIPEDHGDPLYREIDPPRYGLTMLSSLDGRVLGQVFEGGEIVGGNAGRTHLCVHARPGFGDLGPGQTATRRGTVFLTQGSAAEVQARYEASPLEPLPPPSPPVANPYRMPCR